MEKQEQQEAHQIQAPAQVELDIPHGPAPAQPTMPAAAEALQTLARDLALQALARDRALQALVRDRALQAPAPDLALQALARDRALQAPARDREAKNEIQEEVEQDTPAPDPMNQLVQSMERLVSQLQESNALKETELLMKTGIISSIPLPSGEAEERRIPVEKKSTWVEKQKGMLIGVATAIASLATSLVVSPPGGIWQNAPTDTAVCTPSSPCISGTAVSSYLQPALFQEFIKNDCICFVFSMCVILLLLCGFPIYQRAFAWMYTVLMCLALFFWSMIFYKAINLVAASSTGPLSSLDIRSFTGGLLAVIWIPFVGLVSFLVSLGKWVHKKMRKPA